MMYGMSIFAEKKSVERKAGAQNSLGFLTAEKKFSENAKGIGCEILSILQLVEGLESIEKRQLLDRFFDGGPLSPVEIAEKLGIAKAREEAAYHRGDQAWLKGKLERISEGIRSTTAELRLIRKLEEKRDSGGS
jgi:hypothetical protein